MTDLFDVIMPVDPEPCQTCDTGIVYINCWDGKARCRNCVQSLGSRLGWNKYELEWDWDREKPTTIHEDTRIRRVQHEQKLDL